MEGDQVTRKEFAHLQELTAQNLQISQENNRILRAMRKWGRVAFAAKVIIWTVVLIVPVLLYPLIAPYIPGLNGTSMTAGVGSSSLFGMPSPAEIQQLFRPSSKQ